MFRKAERHRCKTCLAKYSAEYYLRKKKKSALDRRERLSKSKACRDAAGSTFYGDGSFKRFCQGRRVIKLWRKDQYTYCNDCLLHDKVDQGFIPKDVIVKRLSLMARFN
ncbi:MAG: hypothetical protein KAR40_14010 [Candidatus Sabulitectum sp.]|nr:hypothetical protein [Candidatus Sabulitectum sp.]